MISALTPPALVAPSCAPTPAVGASGSLGVLPPELRLRWIEGELSRGAGRAQLWTWSWGVALGVGTVANLAPIPFVSRDSRVDWYTGAATTAIGIVPLVIAPLDVIADARGLDARLAARTPGRTPNDVCALLTDAETRLVRDAQNQADGQRWWLHVGNVLVNSGVGLFLILGFHHWGAGVFNAVSGSLIGEAIILTQPTGAIDSLRRYRDGSLDN